jgi:ABC-2 type transport system ATP-binding protein
VDHLDLTVPAGVVTGFLGPNGAGKTTTMRMILGLDVPTSGSVTIDGRLYRDLPTPLREVGSLLDAQAVHPRRSARDHLLYLAQSNGIKAGRVAEVLDIVGLSDAARRKAGDFSLGMCQRLGIAAALLGDPPVLLLDEPSSSLDPRQREVLWSFVGALAARGTAVVFATHDVAEAGRHADRMLILADGELLFTGPPAGVRDATGAEGDLESAVVAFLRERGH